ncbi:MAG: hypothetical protein IT210_19125 [Armatimonadetes bacterium]|nr:hypothetical protein [Armatimonadota bacterium]
MNFAHWLPVIALAGLALARLVPRYTVGTDSPEKRSLERSQDEVAIPDALPTVGEGVNQGRIVLGALIRWLTQAQESRLRLLMACLITFIMLTGTLYVILANRYDDSSQKWAYGAVGSILGYWLKGPEGDEASGAKPPPNA